MTWAPLTMRRNIAYEKLGIDRTLVRTLPPISSQLHMVAKKLRRRNLPASPFYYLKCAPGEQARRIVDLYYSLPKNQRDLPPIEAYCLAVGADSTEILELITRTVAKITRQTSAILAAVNHPAIVEKTVEMALTDDGIEDRRDLHKATGFLPTPRGSQTTVNVAANANAQASSPIAVLAPPPEQTIRRAVDRFNDARLLPSAPPPSILEQFPRASEVQHAQHAPCAVPATPTPPAAMEIDDADGEE